MKINNHQKNLLAQDLLIAKLKSLGVSDIKPDIRNRRRFIECDIEGQRKILHYNSKTKGDWQVTLNHSDDCNPNSRNNKFWILIDVTANRFFVTPERWLAKNIYDSHQAYVDNHGGKRPVNDNSKHHSIPEGVIKEWEETWDIIFNNSNEVVYENEIANDVVFKEGSVTKVYVNAYERNSAARNECLSLKGFQCQICGFDFEKIYGAIGHEFIHVHHIIELSSIKETYTVNPSKDLVPLCPNCHAMVHKRIPAYSIEEMKKFIKENN